MLFTTGLAIATKVAAKVVLGKALTELIRSGETNVDVAEWAVDTLGNHNGHVDMDDITTIGSDLWDFITSVI